MNNTNLYNQVKVCLKRNGLPDQAVRIAPEINHGTQRRCFELYAAFGNPDYMGSILFDENGYWIYEGDVLSIGEQEQLVQFMINYEETC